MLRNTLESICCWGPVLRIFYRQDDRAYNRNAVCSARSQCRGPRDSTGILGGRQAAGVRVGVAALSAPDAFMANNRDSLPARTGQRVKCGKRAFRIALAQASKTGATMYKGQLLRVKQDFVPCNTTCKKAVRPVERVRCL